MERRYLVIMCLLMLVVAVSAQIVDEQMARKTAENFLVGSRNASRAVKANPMKLKLAYRGQTDVPELYLFKNENGNDFVIVSGDERAHAILGYGQSDGTVTDSLPCCLKWMLAQYEEQIAYARSHRLRVPSPLPRSSVAEERHDIPPLVMSKWDQGAPYNGKCPIDPQTRQRCLTGCVATAMAQILYYHKWPEHGTGSKSINYGGTMLTANFGETDYKMETLKETYTSDETDDNLATLLYHCGIAVGMSYGSLSSGAVTDGSEFVNFFGYADCVSFTNPVINDNFMDWVYNELDNHRPLFCAGEPILGDGHAFVCDGFRTDGFLHFNFGWSGNYDGFYRHTAIVADGANYSYSLSFIGGLRPLKPFTVDDSRYYEVDNNEVTLMSARAGESFTIPQYIEHEGMNYTVADADEYAFANVNTVSIESGNTHFVLDGKTLLNSNKTRVFKYFNEMAPADVTEYTIPSTVEKIDGLAFSNANLNHLGVSGALLSIGESAFTEALNPEAQATLALPARLSQDFFQFYEFASSPFFNCGAAVITVGPGGRHYSSNDGILYDANQITVFAVPSGRKKSIVVKDGVTSILPNAFAFVNVPAVRLPSTMKTIYNYAFYFNEIDTLVVPCQQPPKCYSYSLNMKKRFLRRNPETQQEEMHYMTVFIPQGTKQQYMRSNGWRDIFDYEHFVELSAEEMTAMLMTGISKMTAEKRQPSQVIYYDLYGRQTQSPKRGLNIVRQSDGTCRKILVPAVTP